MTRKIKLNEYLRLPETIFDYPSEVAIQVKEKYYDPMTVMIELMPGNVTSRFNPKGIFEWVPPIWSNKMQIDGQCIFEIKNETTISLLVNNLRISFI